MTALINNHVLIPNAADWTDKPQRKRTWLNAVATGNTGPESRQALRKEPRFSLSFTVTPAGIVAAQTLDDRVRAALKSGRACVPFHGRGCVLTASAAAGTDTVEVRQGWRWQAGDWFFAGDDVSYAALAVTDATLAGGIWTLTLADVLPFDLLAGEFVWPLLFGTLAAAEPTAATPRLMPTRLELTELVSGRTAQLGEIVPDAGDGIGHMTVGGTFQVA